MAASPANRRDAKGGSPAALRPRAALLDGDYKRARALAANVLQDASAPEADKEDARLVLDATRVDRGPIVTGLVVLAILLVLFGWVLTRGHAGP